MKILPLIVLISILIIIISTVLAMDLQSKPIEIDVTRGPVTVILEEEEIGICPDSITEIRTRFHCGSNTVERNFEIIRVEGMEKCMMGKFDYYFMQPGQNASVTYEIYRGYDYNDPPRSPPQVQIIRDPSFLHQYDTAEGNSIRELYQPQGIQVLFDSDKTLLGYDESAVITALVSIQEDVDEKTMLLGLTPYTCNGGTDIPFAIVK